MGLVAGEGLRTQTRPSFDAPFSVGRDVVVVAGPADSWQGRVFGPEPGCRSTHPFRWVRTTVVVAEMMDSWRGRVFGPKPGRLRTPPSRWVVRRWSLREPCPRKQRLVIFGFRVTQLDARLRC